MLPRTPISRILHGLLIALIASACGANTATPSPSPIALAKTSIQLAWTHNVEFAPFYVAQAKGYFADQQLSVDLIVGGVDANKNFIDPIQQVVAGKADFGLASGLNFLAARASGQPIVAIGNTLQRDPTAFASLAKANIRRPQDLVGKTVQLGYSATAIFQALLHATGIDPATVKVVTRQDPTIAPLVAGQADVIDIWVTNEGVVLSSQGYNANLIFPSDYGVVLYPAVLFTTEDIIQKKSDMVARFLRAVTRGIQSAVDDPEGSAKLAITYDNTLDLKQQTLAMEQLLPLLLPNNSHPGQMDPSVWNTMQTIMLQQNLLKQPLDLTKAYDLSFLKTAYQATAGQS